MNNARQQDFETATQIGVVGANGIEERLAQDRIGQLSGGLKKHFFLLSGVIHHRNGHTAFILYMRWRKAKTDTDLPAAIAAL